MLKINTLSIRVLRVVTRSALREVHMAVALDGRATTGFVRTYNGFGAARDVVSGTGPAEPWVPHDVPNAIGGHLLKFLDTIDMEAAARLLPVLEAVAIAAVKLGDCT